MFLEKDISRISRLFSVMENESERFCPPLHALKDEQEHVEGCSYCQERRKKYSGMMEFLKRWLLPKDKPASGVAHCKVGEVHRIYGGSRKEGDQWRNPPLVLLLEETKKGTWKVSQVHERHNLASSLDVPLEESGLYAETWNVYEIGEDMLNACQIAEGYEEEAKECLKGIPYGDDSLPNVALSIFIDDERKLGSFFSNLKK